MLATLPSELLDMIVSRSRRDLKRLCEVCIRLHAVTVPHLHQSLVLSASALSLEDFVAILEQIPSKYLKYTQELGFHVPIHERVEARCVHHDANGHFFDAAVQEGLGRIVDPLHNLCCALNSLRFPGDQLRSFRWEVGTCILEAPFCGSDSFLGDQRQIQSITLITDGECGENKTTECFIDLVQFRGLRSLEWRGLNRYNDFESIREFFKVYGGQIQSLTLDLLTWVRAEQIWEDGFRQQNIPGQSTRSTDNFFSQVVLNVHPQVLKVIFPSLENLHLSAVSFCHTGMGMAYAFNIERLRSLMRKCPGSLDWLRMILTLENASMHITETICNFIHQLSGLENLYLMLPEPIDWNTLADRLSSHRHLTRFVMHNLVDRGGQNLIDGDIPWPVQLEHMLQNPLSCFGYSISPWELASHLQRMQPRPPCKMIHVRTSGVVLDRLNSSGQPNWFSESLYTYKYGDDLPDNREAIYDLAQWAFSADGLPSLQVLAWGDFSFEGRYSKFNLLLCRSDNGYKTLTPSDIMAWDLVQDNIDMLAACPFDDILE
ncbi:hypothetical protein BJX70DRAFT_388140 [Aspergillus crustosus]